MQHPSTPRDYSPVSTSDVVIRIMSYDKIYDRTACHPDTLNIELDIII